MASTFLDAGSDATQDLALWPTANTTTGTIASSTTQARTGTRSYKSDVTSSGGRASIESAAGANLAVSAGGCVSYGVYFTSVGAATDSAFGMLSDIGTAQMVGPILRTTGKLRIFAANSGTGLFSSDSTTTLVANTWYRISLAWTISSTTVWSIRLYINGVRNVTWDNGGTMRAEATTIDGLALGWDGTIGTAITQAINTVYIDDVYLDDRTDLSDCGDIRSTAKRAFADGTLVEFTTQIGSGNSGYGSGHADEVNEQPLSETNGWSISTTTRKTEEYAIEPKSMGDVDLTLKYIVGRMGWVRASVDSTANSPVHRLILNGTTTAKTLTTSAATYTVAEDALTYPGGPDAIGLDAQYTTTPHLTRLFEAGVIVAWREDLSPTNATVLPFAFQQRYP